MSETFLTLRTSALAAEGLFHRGTSSDVVAEDNVLCTPEATLLKERPTEAALGMLILSCDLSLSTRFGRAAKYLGSCS